MKNTNAVEQKVLETIQRYNLIEKGDKILAAVSGGADSVCMLHILDSLKDLLGIELFCAHLNHGLRGETADRDQSFVKMLCEEMKIPFFSKTVDIAELAENEKLSTEEAGRKARYAFFDELSEKLDICRVATAHNKNDNAETVLMRVLRGTGVDGLRGISYSREDGVVRPLLDVSRDEIELYCEENGLSFCTDETNAENDYTRNKIRNELIPYLEKEFNTRITDSLCRLSETAREDGDFLRGYAERLYSRLKNPLPGSGNIALHIESLKMVDKGISARVFRIAAEDAGLGAKLEKKHIDDIFDIMKKETGASVDLPDGLRAYNRYGWIAFEGKEERLKRVKLGKDSFFVNISPPETVFVESLDKNISLRLEDAQKYVCKINETAIDFDMLQGEMLFLRSRREGDRIVWFPDGKTKKIKNILIDMKIPKSDRNRIPLLCTGAEILAIVGSRVSEKYKVTKDTKTALIVEYGSKDADK